MKKTLITTAVALVLGLFVAGQVLADVRAGVSFDEDGLKSFVLEIGEHYKAPEKEVKLVREAKLSDDELPVAFHIARHAGVSVEKVIQFRLQKMSWMNITLQLGMNAEIFYVAFDKDPGPPYGKAWGHFKKQKRKHWHKIRKKIANANQDKAKKKKKKKK